MIGWWDPMYLVFAGPALLLGLLARVWIRSAYRKGLQVPNAGNVTGLEGAEILMRQHGLGMRVEVAASELKDNYDPRNDVLCLSQSAAQSASVGSLAIVAHELGHALQDDESYAPMRVRSALVAPVNIGSQLGFALFMVGFVLSYWMGLYSIGRWVSWAGIFGFCIAVLFALVTLPVEFDASRRGLAMLTDSELVAPSEMRYARNVLYAAALSYVAGLLQAVGQVLYYVYRLNRGRRRR